MKSLKSMLIAILTLSLALPGIAAQKKVPTWQKGVMIGVAAGAIGGSIYIARNEAKHEQQRVQKQTQDVDAIVEQYKFDKDPNFLLFGKRVVIVSFAEARLRTREQFTSRETSIAIEAVQTILLARGARVLMSPKESQQTKNALGDRGSQTGDVDLPPLIVYVGARRVSQADTGSNINAGVYDRNRAQKVTYARVHIEVGQKVEETFGSFPEIIATGSGVGDSVVGSRLSQRAGGVYGTDQSFRSEPDGALFHAAASAMQHLR